MTRVGVTGATGFIGNRLVHYGDNSFQLVDIPLRKKSPRQISLSQLDSIVHLVGKAHDMTQVDDGIYFSVNYELTRQLADRAKEEGVHHFIYMSTTKVYGDQQDGWFDESSPCTPTDAYGRSKLKAERYLQSIGDANFRIAIVRPPLVYGPGAKGNVLRLLQLAASKYPLPFGSSGNARSMVFLDNLVDLLHAILHQAAAGTFVAGDREVVSTDELISLMRKHLGRTNQMFAIPQPVRKIIQMTKPELYMRLFGSFVVDNSFTNKQLRFEPRFTTDEGVHDMVDWFVKQGR